MLATGNPDKVREVKQILVGQLELIGLKDIGCMEDLPETSPTLAGNALQKARYVYDHFSLDCFAEDTGLEIEALNGEPGVLTARYAGNDKNPEANIALVLEKMEGISNRKACFKTVIALIIGGKEHTFEGVATGTIATAPSGANGFGYDPIFRPDGYFGKTFAEMDKEEKNAVSHRAKALALLKSFLDKHRATP